LVNDAVEKRSTSSTDIVRAFLTRMEQKDTDGMLALLTDDSVMECVLGLDGDNAPRRFWDGMAGARDHYIRAFDAVESIEFADVSINQTLDANLVFAEALGSMTMSNGRPYDNRYVFRFELRDGKIAMLREYCNPVTAAISFERPMPTW
jgi:ketosteroid isomerase-like protein